jgi:hypothetical protein
MTVRTHALQRSIRALTIDGIRALDKRREMLGFDAMGEFEQQFQIELEVMVAFDVDFYNAVDQRDSPYTLPHFTYGAVITGGAPALITACVRQWDIDDTDTVHGATVAVGVCNPGTEVASRFIGQLHMTFQGYGAPVEGSPPDLDTGD